MKLVGAALLYDDDGAAGRVAIFGRESGRNDLGFLDGAEDGIGGVGAAWLDAVHAILEVTDVAGGAAVDREAAEGAGIRQAARIYTRRKVEDGAGVALVQRHSLEVLAIHDGARGGCLGFEQLEPRQSPGRTRLRAPSSIVAVNRQGRADAQFHILPDESS